MDLTDIKKLMEDNEDLVNKIKNNTKMLQDTDLENGRHISSHVMTPFGASTVISTLLTLKILSVILYLNPMMTK
jgi:archaellin